jgi:hypothetical protein
MMIMEQMSEEIGNNKLGVAVGGSSLTSVKIKRSKFTI